MQMTRADFLVHSSYQSRNCYSCVMQSQTRFWQCDCFDVTVDLCRFSMSQVVCENVSRYVSLCQECTDGYEWDAQNQHCKGGWQVIRAV